MRLTYVVFDVIRDVVANEHSGEYLPNAPLKEAVVALKWALPTVSQGLRTDRELDLALGRFHKLASGDFPEFERLSPPVSPAFLLTNYQPVFRFADPSGYPLVQLGSGIFTYNQSGRNYDWPSFPEELERGVAHLIEAYPSDYLKLVELEFILVNSLDLEAFEAFLMAGNQHPGGQVNVSYFFREHMGLRFEKEYEAPDRRFLRQEVVQSYRIADDSVLTVRHRDDSEEQGKQTAYWEIVVRTEAQGLPLTVHHVRERLDRAHTTTRAIFSQMQQTSTLRNYFKAHPSESTTDVHT